VPKRSRWDVALWIALGLWLAACGTALMLAAPLVRWLLSLSIPLIEGEGDPAFYVERLRRVLPFFALVGGLYGLTLHAVFLPGGLVSRFLAARRRRTLVLLVVAVALLLALTPRYLTGDEPHYLAMMESLWRDRDLNLANQAGGGALDVLSHAVSGADRVKAYSVHFPGLAVLLLLPYGLFGAKGVIISMALLWVAVVLVTQSWSRRTAIRPSPEPDPILLTAALSVPLSVLPGIVYPEIPAALLIAAAVASLEVRAEGALWTACAAVAALPWFQVRLLGTALVVALMAWRVLGRRAWLPLVALAASLAVQGFVFESWYGDWVPWAMYPKSMGIPRGNPIQGVLGMLFDQQAGLLSTSPFYVLLVPALLSAWRRKRTQTLWRLVIVASYLAPVMGSNLWHGNWSPPARLWGPVLPILLVWIFAYVRERAESPRRLVSWRVLALLSLVWGLLYCLFPDKRCSVLGAQGSNFFLSVLAKVSHLPVSLVFPRLQQPGRTDLAVAVVELALWVIIGWVAFRRRTRALVSLRPDGR